MQKEEQEKFNRIKQRLAKIVWELNKKRKGYQLLIGSEVHLLLVDLINNFNYTLLEDNTLLSLIRKLKDFKILSNIFIRI